MTSQLESRSFLKQLFTNYFYIVPLIGRCILIFGLFLSTFIFVTISFPFLKLAIRQRILFYFSHCLLNICRVRLVLHGYVENKQTALLVSNHISWLDIFVINAWHPVSFVAKAEIRRWPVIGWLAAKVQTIFIDRTTIHRIKCGIVDVNKHLLNDELVVLFPEGMTSDGSQVLPFHSSFFACAQQTSKPILPLAIYYEDSLGNQSTAPAYAGNTSLLQALYLILKEDLICAHLYIGKAKPAEQKNRRLLALNSHESIANMIIEIKNKRNQI